MKKYLLPHGTNAYKANLHAHTNISDGALTSEQVKDLYKSNGYSVVAYTDHDLLIPHDELTDKDFLALPGFEAQFNGSNMYPGKVNEKKCHICFIGNTVQPCWKEEYAYIGNAKNYRSSVKFDEETSPFDRDYSPECINTMISAARKKGFFITYNHPVWSLEGYEQYIKYDGMHAIEIFNYGTEILGFQSLAPHVYDDILRNGRKIFAVAADDNHNKHGIDDSFGGFVMIMANELNHDCIMQALFHGDFYASTGPAFHDVYIENNTLFIQCSDVSSISLTTDGRKTKCIYSKSGEALKEATFALDFDYQYFRITIKDFKGNYAYTNAFFKEDL